MELPEKDTFLAITIEVIRYFEGGYYHPNMYKKDPVRFSAYTKSGETMFGLDRHAGHDLFYSTPRKASSVFDNIKHIESGEYVYKTTEAEGFWNTIDQANAQHEWGWNTRGGKLEVRLLHFASDIMYFEFIRLANKFLTTASKEIVYTNRQILFHFAYATWNGEGFFNYYSKRFNQLIKVTQNTDVLLMDCIEQRLNSDYSSISNSGKKMFNLFLKSTV
jgi:hypothetical protein